MTTWKLEKKRIKNYSHFDAPLTVSDAEDLANDPKRVAAHKFFPFLKYEKRWTEFAIKGNSGKIKSRPISFAARADSYIYMRYREMLSGLYESKLNRNQLSSAVLAYRKLTDPLTGAGKSNIHFASEAFDEIRRQKNCCAIAVDISDYFGSIDHALLEKQLLNLVGTHKLPPDLLAVFKNITSYSTVDLLKAYERLGYFGNLPQSPPGKNHRGYLKPKHEIDKQICSTFDFRQKIAGGNGKPSIIQKNPNKYGIPQGSPISDLLANIYLFDFDLYVQKEIQKLGGKYTRYSDDILVIAPIDTIKAMQLEQWLRNTIVNYGDKLKIKQAKSLVLEFFTDSTNQDFRIVYDGKSKVELVRFQFEKPSKALHDMLSSKAMTCLKQEYDRGRMDLNGFDYLGFRFDGKQVFLRDSTYSNLRRKIKTKCRIAAHKFIRERSTLTNTQLSNMFALEINRLIGSFGKVRNFETDDVNPQHWTFTTYVKKISTVLDPTVNSVAAQLKDLHKIIRTEAQKAFQKALVQSSR